MFDKLLDKYPCIVFFDIETTGFSPEKENIIELAATAYYRKGFLSNRDNTVFQMDTLVKLPDNKKIPGRIVQLTHITDAMLNQYGRTSDEVFKAFYNISGMDKAKALLIAHNAQFDVSFMLESPIKEKIIDCDYLDTLTVARDRGGNSHKLADLITAYHVKNVSNTHRAIDDVNALVGVTEALINERDDLADYINVFGFNPDFGRPKKNVINKVIYCPQPKSSVIKSIGNRTADKASEEKKDLAFCEQLKFFDEEER